MWNILRNKIGSDSRRSNDGSSSLTETQKDFPNKPGPNNDDIACYKREIKSLKACVEGHVEQMKGITNENNQLRIEVNAARLTSKSSMTAVSCILDKRNRDEYGREAERLAWKAIAKASLSRTEELGAELHAFQRKELL